MKKNREIYIVAGGAGLVGGYLIDQIRAEHPNAEIVITTRLGTENPEILKYVEEKGVSEVLSADAAPDYIRENKGYITGVIDCGAAKQTNGFDANHYDTWNFEKPAALFDAVAEAENISYVCLSSIFAAHPLSNHYAASKAKLEHHIRNSDKKPNRMTILRPTNIYAPDEFKKSDPNHSSIIAKFVTQAENGENISLFQTDQTEDGSLIRGFIHAQDMAKVALWAIDNDTPEELYDVGRTPPTSLKSVYDELRKYYSHLPEEPETIPCPDHVSPVFAPDLTLLHRDFPPMTSTSLEDGIQSMVEAREKTPQLND